MSVFDKIIKTKRLQTLKLISKFFWEITSKQENYDQIFTDGVKVDEKVAAAAVSSVAPNNPF